MFAPGVYWFDDDASGNSAGFQAASGTTLMMCNDCTGSADTGNDGHVGLHPSQRHL